MTSVVVPFVHQPTFSPPQIVTQAVTVRWSSPTIKEPVDVIIDELVTNPNFVRYIKGTNKEILKNPGKFEDMAEKYK